MGIRYESFLFVILVFTLFLCGCGRSDLPDLASVSGVVTLDGAPSNVEVIFSPESGGHSSIGRTDAKGAYELQYTLDAKGAIIGNHAVTISTPLPEGGNYAGFKKSIPAKYNQKSELKVQVESGGTRKNFELTSK